MARGSRRGAARVARQGAALGLRLQVSGALHKRRGELALVPWVCTLAWQLWGSPGGRPTPPPSLAHAEGHVGTSFPFFHCAGGRASRCPAQLRRPVHQCLPGGKHALQQGGLTACPPPWLPPARCGCPPQPHSAPARRPAPADRKSQGPGLSLLLRPGQESSPGGQPPKGEGLRQAWGGRTAQPLSAQPSAEHPSKQRTRTRTHGRGKRTEGLNRRKMV